MNILNEFIMWVLVGGALLTVYFALIALFIWSFILNSYKKSKEYNIHQNDELVKIRKRMGEENEENN